MTMWLSLASLGGFMASPSCSFLPPPLQSTFSNSPYRQVHGANYGISRALHFLATVCLQLYLIPGTA